MSFILTEYAIEEEAPAWLGGLGYSALHGPDVPSGEIRVRRAERSAERTA